MVVKVEPPDFQTRCEICRRFAQRIMTKALGESKSAQAGQLSESVVRFVAEQVRTNVRELEGALLKLAAFAALQDEKITLAAAQTVLAEHIERCDPIVHVSDIETTVATYFGTTPSTIHSSKKDRTVALARHFSMYLTRKHTNMSSSEIGRAMGNKNHATVLVACKKIEGLLERDEEIHWQGPQGNKVGRAKAIVSHLEDTIARG
jgi:chromosomal replication initiator protein